MNKKNFIWNIIGSLTNASTSLFFMIIVTRINGESIAGIFSFAFTFSLLIQVIGYYAGRSYQVTETDEKIKDSDFIYNRILTCIIMILIASFFLLFKRYSYEKSIIILILTLYKTVECIADCLYGIIQRSGKLYQVGISLFLKGISMIVLFLLTNIITKNIIISITTLFIVNLILVIFYDWKNVKKLNFTFYKLKKENLINILKGGFFVFIFNFLIQYVLNASKYSIDNYLSDKYQLIYGIILMPSTLIGLFSQFFVQPFLVKITEFVKTKDYKALNKLNIRISFMIVITTLIAEIMCYLFGIQLLDIIYGLKLASYKIPLLLIIVGATFYSLSYLLSTSLIAMRQNFIQTIIYLITTIFTFIISEILVKDMKILGASIAYLITMLILLLLYIIVYIYYIKKKV